MTAYTKIILNEAIAALSEKYGFDVEEGSRTIGLADLTVTKCVNKKAKKEVKEKKEKKKAVKSPKPKFALPWTGEVNNDLCMGIKNNNFLFTQCTSKPVDGKKFCNGCQKQCDTNSFGKPSGGTVEDRLAVGPLDYVGPKDKVKVHSYGNYLAKKKISREDAIAEAEKFNVEIPEFQFEVHERKRGRPKKETRSAAVSDSSSGSESESEAPKKKVKKVKKEKKEKKVKKEKKEKKVHSTAVQSAVQHAVAAHSMAERLLQQHQPQVPTQSAPQCPSWQCDQLTTKEEESELYKALAEKKEEKKKEEKNEELEIDEIEMSEVESESDMSEVESESESEMSDSE